jgi:hypothetical protein
MDRNDKIFLGFVSAASIAVPAGYILARYANVPSVAPWAQLSVSAVAIVIALYVPMRLDRDRRRDSQRIATMAIASQLQRWMRRAASELADNRRYDITRGFDGARNISIPHFSFEADIDRIVSMPVRWADQVLALLEDLGRTDHALQASARLVDGDRCLQIYYQELSKLFARVMVLSLALTRSFQDRSLDIALWQKRAVRSAWNESVGPDQQRLEHLRDLADLAKIDARHVGANTASED